MTTVIEKPDRRRGLRAMTETSRKTFGDMPPENQMSVLFDYQKEQTGTLNNIHKILIGKGNGEDGLVTQTALNKQSISRVWKAVLILFPGTLTVIGIFIGISKFWG